MTEQIGDSSISPRDREIYKQDFNEAVTLFQQSLAAYEKSQIQAQKDKFKDVMDKCQQVIHETIQSALKKESAKQLQQFDKDYQNFITNDNSQTYAQLNNDLESFKKST